MHANQALARFLSQLARAADELAAELTRAEEDSESTNGQIERGKKRHIAFDPAPTKASHLRPADDHRQ